MSFISSLGDTSDRDYSRSLGYSWTICHKCIYLWSWTVMLTGSYRSWARTVWILLRMSTEICRLGEGHSLCPRKWRLSIRTYFPRISQKCCQLEIRASRLCLLKRTCSTDQSVSLQNRVPRVILPNICIFEFHFCEWRSSLQYLLAWSFWWGMVVASPKVGQDQVSGGVSVLCWHAAPVANVLWKPLAIA